MSRESLAKYIPTVLEREGRKAYVEFVLELALCAGCDRPMLPKDSRSERGGGVFPNWRDLNGDAQRERGNIGVRSAFNDKDHRPLCQDCANAGKATFICALCEQERPSDQEQESFGHPASTEYLCKPCYESVPAKAWDEKTEDLRDSHRYDWE